MPVNHRTLRRALLIVDRFPRVYDRGAVGVRFIPGEVDAAVDEDRIGKGRNIHAPFKEAFPPGIKGFSPFRLEERSIPGAFEDLPESAFALVAGAKDRLLMVTANDRDVDSSLLKVFHVPEYSYAVGAFAHEIPQEIEIISTSNFDFILQESAKGPGTPVDITDNKTPTGPFVPVFLQPVGTTLV